MIAYGTLLAGGELYYKFLRKFKDKRPDCPLQRQNNKHR